VGATGLADTAWNSALGVSASFPGLRTLARGAFHSATYLTAFHEQTNHDLSKFSTGAYIYPDISYQPLAGFSKAAQSQVRWANVFQRVATWAQQANTGAYLHSALTEAADVDLDGEAEYLLFNDRVFILCEAIGGRVTAAWVRDLVTGNVLQAIGNPLSYPGFEGEVEGAANIVNGAVGSYRTSAFKDCYAAGPNSVQYVNDVSTVTSVAGGWRFTSPDGKVQKTLTLATRANAVAASYTLDASISTLYTRHGLSPNLLQLLQQGQSTLSAPIAGLSDISIVNNAPGQKVRAYIRTGGTFAGATHVTSAVDDNPGQGITFDTLNMRNQAQTHQIEIAGGNGMTFALGFETGPTLSLDLDNDSLPDAWEQDNGLDPTIPTGIHGPAGDSDHDGMSNYHEFVVGRSLAISDRYLPEVAKVAAGFTITFDTIADRLYRVCYSDTLGGWTAFDSIIPGTGSTVTVIDDGSSTSPHPNTRTRRFYRVEVALTNP